MDLNLTDFTDHFKTDKECEDHLIKERFKNGEYCSSCGHKHISRINRNRKHQYFKCAGCRKEFTILTNTVFHGSKVPLRKWFICIHLLTTTGKGISSLNLSKQLCLTQKTMWHMLTRLRNLTKAYSNEFQGTSEIDKIYVGGKEKNQHTDKKGLLKKQVVVGVVNRETKKVKAAHVSNIKTVTLEKYVYENIQTGSTVYTNDNPS